MKTTPFPPQASSMLSARSQQLLADWDQLLESESKMSDEKYPDIFPTYNPRKRKMGGSSIQDKRIKTAIAINARMNKLFPYSQYGRMYTKRGTEANLATFGPDWKTASEIQRKMRKSSGYLGKGLYMGRGRYRGRGGFFGDLWEGVKSIGRPLLGAVAPVAGQMLTSSLGKLAGQGEYVNTNSLVRTGQTAFEPPMFTEKPDGASVTISYKEYVGEVFGPPSVSTYQNTAYAINPGIERSFPWLSQIAANYDEYTIHQLIYTYRSTVADFASSSGQIGTIIMATQYNANSQPFTDKIQMMQYDAALSGKSSEHHIHGVECDPNKLSGPKGRYVRTAPVLSGNDANQYDHGVFNIAVTDIPSTYVNQALGELWVSYTIELRKPKFFTARGLAISRDVFACKPTARTYSAPFGTVAGAELLEGQQNSLGTELVPTNGVLTMPANLPSLIGGAVSTASVYAFRLNFPANYAGIVRITFTQENQGAPAAAAIYGWWAQGNIVPWKGMITSTGAWNTRNYSTLTAVTGTTFTVDVRVSPATNGVDNSIFVDETAATAATFSCYMDVTEMNSGLSYKTDGTNDAPLLVNTAGVITV